MGEVLYLPLPDHSSVAQRIVVNLTPVYRAMADRILEIYKEYAEELLQAFEKTSMRKKDWKGTDAIVQWLLFTIKPGDPLDAKLEKIGLKPSWEKRPGYRGFFWGTEYEEQGRAV